MRGLGLDGTRLGRIRQRACTRSQATAGHGVPFLAGVNRNDLPRIRPPLRIEHRAQLAHGVERALGKDGFHVSHLVEPNTVLTRDAAARIDACLHDLGHRLVHSLAFDRIVRAVGDVRMKISVTRVKDVAYDDAVPVSYTHLTLP